MPPAAPSTVTLVVDMVRAELLVVVVENNALAVAAAADRVANMRKQENQKSGNSTTC